MLATAAQDIRTGDICEVTADTLINETLIQPAKAIQSVAGKVFFTATTNFTQGEQVYLSLATCLAYRCLSGGTWPVVPG